MAQAVEDPAGAAPPASVKSILGPIQELVRAGLKDRAQYEATWRSNRAFGAGKHWLKPSRSDRKLYLDKRDVGGGRERTKVDILTQRIQTGLGQLSGIEERPQLLFRREDLPSENFTRVANDGLQYGWDSEWNAKRQLARTKRRIVIDGTAAIQCLFDPTVGRELGDVPLGDGYGIPVPVVPGAEDYTQDIPTQAGQPITDGEHARAFVADRRAQGEQVQFRSMNEGRICWKPRSVFNIIVPPGIEDEDEFPWIAVITAASIETLILRYGEQARSLKEEPLAAAEAVGQKEGEAGFGDDEEGFGSGEKLKGHVALVQWFGMPDSQHPKGRVVTYVRDTLLEAPRDELPYKKPNGDYSAGIAFFHYWRVEGRFWGRALIEPGKGIQRAYNKRCQQEQLTIDRGQPKVFLEEQNELKAKSQTPMEVIRYRSGMAAPVYHQGMGPGEWIWKSKDALKIDLEDALGIHAVSTGEEPSRQTTYAELSLRAAKDQVKLDPITESCREGVRALTEFSLWDMRRYWSADKVIALEGETGEAESVQFAANKLPEFYLFKAAEGTKPRDQASEIQLIFDLYSQALNIGQPLPIEWLYDSIRAGRALPLPEKPTDLQVEKAQWENSQMWDGKLPEPQPWDEIAIHAPNHREAQIEAEMAGRMDVVELVQRHLDMSLGLTQALSDEQAANAASEVAQAQGPAGTPSGILGPLPPAPATPPTQGVTSG